MAAGDVIVLVKEITKISGTDITQLDAFTSMPATATDVQVRLIPRTANGDNVVYDAVATGIAAS